MRTRLATWLGRWWPLFPILVAEAVVWIGFGAILPVLPIYATDNGIDVATFGVIAAALPAARLVFEPLFGVLADRIRRRPLLVAALVLSAVSSALPLLSPTVGVLLVARAAAGVAAAMYDPAARGLNVDMTAEDQRGEAFGLYGSAQTGGLMLGPAIGALGAAVFSGFAFPFLFGAATSVIAGAYLMAAFHEGRSVGTAGPPVPAGHGHAARTTVVVPPPFEAATPLAAPDPDAPVASEGGRSTGVGRATRATSVGATPVPLAAPGGRDAPARRIVNRLTVAAILMNFGFFFSVGVYEVVWSLYVVARGGSIAWVGFTFVTFSFPIIVLSPFAGRLIDRLGGLWFAVVGGICIASTGVLYALAADSVTLVWITIFEGTANAFLGPALFALLAAGTPRGRSSTTQGLYGAAGTLGFIIAALAAGALYDADPRLPFVFFAAVAIVAIGVGTTVAWGADTRARPEPAAVAPG